MKSLFLILALLIQSGAQMRHHVSLLKSVRVVVAPPHDNQLNQELAAEVRARLRALGYVEFNSNKPDYDIGFVIAPLATDVTKCSGFMASMVIVDLSRPHERKQSLYIGADVQSLALEMTGKLKEEFFSRGH